MRFLTVFVTLFAIVLADISQINTPNTRIQGITTVVSYTGTGNGKTTVLVRDANDDSNVPAQFDVVDGAGKYDWDTNVPPGSYYFEAGSVQSGQFKVIADKSGGGNGSSGGNNTDSGNSGNSGNGSSSGNSTNSNGGKNGTSSSGGSPTGSGSSSSPQPSRAGNDSGSSAANALIRGTPFAFFVTFLAVAVAMM